MSLTDFHTTDLVDVNWTITVINELRLPSTLLTTLRIPPPAQSRTQAVADGLQFSAVRRLSCRLLYRTVSSELLGFVFSFSLFLVSVPCDRLQWQSRQLLNAPHRIIVKHTFTYTTWLWWFNWGWSHRNFVDVLHHKTRLPVFEILRLAIWYNAGLWQDWQTDWWTHWRRQLWGTGARAPSTYNNLFFSVYKVWQRLYVDSCLL